MEKDTLRYLEQSLEGFFSKVALIGEVSTKVLIETREDGQHDIKYVIGKPADIVRGNVLLIDGQSWLITSFPEDSNTYKKAIIQLCNDVMSVVTGTERVMVGRDSFGRPIYENRDTYANVPVVFTSKGFASIENEALTLPDGKIDILMKYVPSYGVAVNQEYTFKGDKRYKITTLDYDRILNDTGVLMIRADRVTSTT